MDKSLVLYRELEARLQDIADKSFTHRKHLCEEILKYPFDVQDKVIKILNEQLKLLVKINRTIPLPFETRTHLRNG